MPSQTFLYQAVKTMLLKLSKADMWKIKGLRLTFRGDIVPLSAWVGKWLETLFPALVELNVVWAFIRNIHKWDLMNEGSEKKVRDYLDEVKVIGDKSLDEIVAKRGGKRVPPVLSVR